MFACVARAKTVRDRDGEQDVSEGVGGALRDNDNLPSLIYNTGRYGINW